MSKGRLFCRTGEVTAMLDLESHVLRYWEARFPKIVRPIRRSDGRRLYRPEDVSALTAIKVLVRQKGLTLKAAAKLLDKISVDEVLNNPSADTDTVDIWPKVQNAASQGNITLSGERGRSDTIESELEKDLSRRLNKTLNRLEDIKARIDGTKAIETGRVAA